MSAEDLASWLSAHGHDDVEVLAPDQVATTYKNKGRTYVLANDTTKLGVGDDFWRILKGRP